eukprot:GFYU01012991.1.p1 GENE.GFYU01012991.1~~GFYU01012991.1.p1  ORF type:complete len:653 (+),score=126.11 GFYU01012991.1:107-1960(+)
MSTTPLERLFAVAETGSGTEFVEAVVETLKEANIRTNVVAEIQQLVNCPSQGGTTMLMSACRQGNKEVISKLLEAGADPCARSALGNEALMFAAGAGDVSILRLLDAHPSVTEQHWNHVNNNGDSALMFCCMGNNEKTTAVEFLLSKGVDVYTQNVHGLTALMCATKHNRQDLVRTVLRYDMVKAVVCHRGYQHKAPAYIDAQDGKGCTALHYAAKQNNEAIVATLLESGANPLIRNQNGESAVVLCTEDKIQRLLNDAADIAMANDPEINGFIQEVTKPATKHKPKIRAKPKPTPSVSTARDKSPSSISPRKRPAPDDDDVTMPTVASVQSPPAVAPTTTAAPTVSSVTPEGGGGGDNEGWNVVSRRAPSQPRDSRSPNGSHSSPASAFTAPHAESLTSDHRTRSPQRTHTGSGSGSGNTPRRHSRERASAGTMRNVPSTTPPSTQPQPAGWNPVLPLTSQPVTPSHSSQSMPQSQATAPSAVRSYMNAGHARHLSHEADDSGAALTSNPRPLSPRGAIHRDHALSSPRPDETLYDNTWADRVLKDLDPTCPELDVRWTHILGADLHKLSASQLDAIETVYFKLLRNLTEAKISLARRHEREMIEAQLELERELGE